MEFRLFLLNFFGKRIVKILVRKKLREGVMKNKILLLVLFPAIIMLLQGCYTELATNEDNSGYGSYSAEPQSSSNNSNYDVYPPSTYWGFQFYYPSWSSFWIYERWYYNPYVWYTPWYDPWFGAAIVVYPAPYWYHHHYYPNYWGWYDGGYGYYGYGKPTVPRTWGSQRPSDDNNYRDFGPSRSSGEGGSSRLTIPSAGRVSGSSRSGEAAPSRQQSSEATESPRGVSTGRTAAPSRSADAPRQTEQRGGVTRQSQSDNAAPSRSSDGQEQQSGKNSGSTRSSSSGSSEGSSNSRGGSSRSVERSSSPSSQPSSPAPSRSSGGSSGRSGGSSQGRSTR